jgi:hypothetical protein
LYSFPHPSSSPNISAISIPTQHSPSYHPPHSSPFIHHDTGHTSHGTDSNNSNSRGYFGDSAGSGNAGGVDRTTYAHTLNNYAVSLVSVAVLDSVVLALLMVGEMSIRTHFLHLINFTGHQLKVTSEDDNGDGEAGDGVVGGGDDGFLLELAKCLLLLFLKNLDLVTLAVTRTLVILWFVFRSSANGFGVPLKIARVMGTVSLSSSVLLYTLSRLSCSS